MYLIENWAMTEHLSPPGAGELHLWRLDLNSPEGGLLALLSADEQERAGRFLTAEDRQHFIQARGGLRLILGQYLEAEPAQLRFGYGNQGKPFIQQPTTGLTFNLSHSRGQALLAVTTGHTIGVDLESPRLRPNLKAIARRVFDEGIQQELAPLQGDALALAFFRHWTTYEARLKAQGEGIFHGDKLAGMGLTSMNFIPQEGWMAAVAIEGDMPAFNEWKTCQFQASPLST